MCRYAIIIPDKRLIASRRYTLDNYLRKNAAAPERGGRVGQTGNLRCGEGGQSSGGARGGKAHLESDLMRKALRGQGFARPLRNGAAAWYLLGQMSRMPSSTMPMTISTSIR